MKYFITIFLSFLCLSSVVLADDAVYYNKNNVAFTEEELAYIDALFYEGYYSTMSQEEHDIIFADGVPNIDTIVSKSVLDYNYLRDVSYSTANKKITLSKNVTSSGVQFNITAEWINNPKVRSYDVIGARFNVSQNASGVFTRVKSHSASTSYNNVVKTSNGVGCSVLLPSNQSNLIITQFFILGSNSRVTASYQHAKSEVSLSDSMNYGFSASGLGGVFAFNNGVSTKYDGMLGVYLD